MSKTPLEPVEAMMRRFENGSSEMLGFLYFDLDSLYLELNYLNKSLNNFMAGKLGENYMLSDKKKTMDEIRERIPAIYEEIKHVKLCIQAEKFNMNRLRSKYGNTQIKFRQRHLNLDRHYKHYDLENSPILEQPVRSLRPPQPLDGIYEDTQTYNDVDDEGSSWNPFEYDDENYIDEYKFNPLLGTVEKNNS